MFMEHKMTYISRTHDASTGEITERPFTAKEIAEVEANIAKAEAELQTAQTKAAARSALLERLGISEDEARLLLG
jgi:hypothetical protein